MGCGSSQAVSVVNSTSVKNRPNNDNLVVQSLSIKEENKNETRVEAIATTNLTISNKNESNSFSDRPALEARKSTFMPLIPLNVGPNYQGTPFDSGKSSKADLASNFELDKESRRSSYSDNDSGYLDKEYKNVITEKSDNKIVQKIENDFKSKDNLELGVNGKACPPILSEKEKKIEKEKKEELKVNEILRDNGLVQRPLTAKRNYATFDIVEEKFLSQQKNSQKVRLPRILRDKKVNKPNLTSDDIEKKLEKANQRKMERTQLKIKNLQSSISLDRRTETPQNNNYNQEMLDRQQKLRHLRDHLRAKKGETDELSAETPRTNQLVNELNHFRPKTPASFKPTY